MRTGTRRSAIASREDSGPGWSGPVDRADGSVEMPGPSMSARVGDDAVTAADPDQRPAAVLLDEAPRVRRPGRRTGATAWRAARTAPSRHRQRDAGQDLDQGPAAVREVGRTVRSALSMNSWTGRRSTRWFVAALIVDPAIMRSAGSCIRPQCQLDGSAPVTSLELSSHCHRAGPRGPGATWTSLEVGEQGNDLLDARRRIAGSGRDGRRRSMAVPSELFSTNAAALLFICVDEVDRVRRTDRGGRWHR